jgi:hypothetical protein
MGGFVLCPTDWLPALHHRFVELGCGVLAIAAGLYSLIYSFQQAGFDADREPPPSATVIDIMAATALILYGLFLALPAGLQTLSNSLSFRLVSGSLAMAIGGCGWAIDWYTGGARNHLLWVGLLAGSIEKGLAWCFDTWAG